MIGDHSEAGSLSKLTDKCLRHSPTGYSDDFMFEAWQHSYEGQIGGHSQEVARASRFALFGPCGGVSSDPRANSACSPL